jgi:hypothetical protein
VGASDPSDLPAPGINLGHVTGELAQCALGSIDRGRSSASLQLNQKSPQCGGHLPEGVGG